MKNKKMLITLIVLLAVGFASVSTTLIINGVIGIASNESDFNIIFTSAKLNNVERKDFIEQTKKQTLTFATDKLTTIDESAVLDYEVTNTSRLYDADVKIECNLVDEEENVIENSYINIQYQPNSMELLAGETKSGSITARLIKASTEDQSVQVKCTLNASALERDTLGEEYIEPEVNYLALTTSAPYYDDFMAEYYGSEDEYLKSRDAICEGNEGSDKCYAFHDKYSQNYDEYMTKNGYDKFIWSYHIDEEKIESINIVSTNEVPDNKIVSWDASHQQNGSIMAYTLDEDNNGLYEFYIGQDGGVIANPDSSSLFSRFSIVTSINGLENLDTSNVRNMSYMFDGLYELTTLDISALDTSKVTNMTGMFSYCYALTELDVSNLNTSKVTMMNAMFMHCSDLIDLDLSNFDTRNVVNMRDMFRDCWDLMNVNLSNFDTKNVTNMGDMFNNCRKIQNVDLSNFDTRNVTNMAMMFERCTNLQSVDLSNFDTRNVIDMDWMFSECTSLQTLDLSSFYANNTVTMFCMFDNCTSLQNLDLSNFDISNVSDKTNVFRSMPTSAIVKVKDENAQTWILNLSSSNRPSAWTTDNVIIA